MLEATSPLQYTQQPFREVVNAEECLMNCLNNIIYCTCYINPSTMPA